MKESAVDLLSKRNEERPFLRLKLENLGISPKPIEPKEQVVDTAAMQQAQVAVEGEMDPELKLLSLRLEAAASGETAQ